MSFLFLDLGITDMVTGAMWAYPSSVSIALEPTGQPATVAATAAPAVPQRQPAVQIGQESYQVERMREAKVCHPQPVARLVGKGPSSETYTIACANGDALTVRCEFGACRVTR